MSASHGISRPSHVLASALFPISTWESALRALQPILSMMSEVGGVFASVFSRLSKNRLNPKRALFLVPCLAIFERSIVCFYRDILEKMKLILAFCSICERENFLKALFPFAFSELGPYRVNFQLV